MSQPSNKPYPLVDDAEKFLREQRDLKQAKALVPAYQQVIENCARTTINALQAGFLSPDLVARLREAITFADTFSKNQEKHP